MYKFPEGNFTTEILALNHNLECGYIADLIVEDLIVEDKVLLAIKAIEGISNIQIAQILTYLRIGNFRPGFLINFNVILFKYGIKRVVL